MIKIFLFTTIITGSSLFLISAKGDCNWVSHPQRVTHPVTKQDKKKGKEVYTLNCQSCHMEKGEGLEGVYPPLAKTNYLKDTKKLIEIVLKGQSGEIMVNGKKYNTDMPAQAYLTDEQIADVLTYVRSSWGNKYPAVKPTQVKAQRK